MVRKNYGHGRVEIHAGGAALPYSIFDENPCITQGAIVENKRLGAVLAVIQQAQMVRDRMRVESKKLTVREKDRVRAAWKEAVPAPTPSSNPEKRTFLPSQKADISTWP